MAAFVGFESAAIYSEECRDPKRTVARATYIAVALIAGFYALSSWLLSVAAGPDTIVNPDALVAAGFATGDAPDPTTVLFITGAGPARRVLGRRQLAAVRDVAVRGAAVLPQRRRALRVRARAARACCPASSGASTRAPARRGSAPLAQTVLALAIVLVFAIAGADPVLKLFTWLTNLGALGVLLLMAATSFAVFGYFRRRPEPGLSTWSSTIAPLLSGVLLAVILILGVANFNVLITSATDAPTDTMTIVLPLILFGGGALGLVVGAMLKSRKPDVYARIGEGRE